MLDGLIDKLTESPKFAAFQQQLGALVAIVKQTHMMVAAQGAELKALRAELAQLKGDKP